MKKDKENAALVQIIEESPAKKKKKEKAVK
jgi:hypothetical protein